MNVRIITFSECIESVDERDENNDPITLTESYREGFVLPHKGDLLQIEWAQNHTLKHSILIQNAQKINWKVLSAEHRLFVSEFDGKDHVLQSAVITVVPTTWQE